MAESWVHWEHLSDLGIELVMSWAGGNEAKARVAVDVALAGMGPRAAAQEWGVVESTARKWARSLRRHWERRIQQVAEANGVDRQRAAAVYLAGGTIGATGGVA